jgi:hypothetical protein
MLAEVDDISARLKNIVETYRDQNYPNPSKSGDHILPPMLK